MPCLRSIGGPWGRLLLSLLAALGGCAIYPKEVHLAPLFSTHRAAGGGMDVEALGGILRWRRNPERTEVAAFPVLRVETRETSSRVDVLFPLSLSYKTPGSHFVYAFPLGWWRRRDDPAPNWDFALLPFFFGGRQESGEGWFAFFPIFGTHRGLLTIDRLRYVLFPLYVSTEKKDGWRTESVLWPLFGWSRKGDAGKAWRVFPLVGWTRDGEDRHFYLLWPIFQRERGRRESIHVLPIFGRAREGNQVSTTVLWPFFGWSRNPETGFFVLDAPWPFVRILRNARGGTTRGTRVIPFFAHRESKDIRSRTFLWPLFWIREEEQPGFTRRSFLFLPFVVASRTHRGDGTTAALTHVWPFFHRERSGEESEVWIPTLLPFPRLAAFRENVERPFALWISERKGGAVTRRGFLDLYREDADEMSRRWSVPLLAACRTTPDGTRDWSTLLGLLRFRTGPGGFRLLAPAFPGPGF